MNLNKCKAYIYCFVLSVFMINCNSEDKEIPGDQTNSLENKSELKAVIGDTLQIALDFTQKVKNVNLFFKDQVLYQSSNELMGKQIVPLLSANLGIGKHKLKLAYTMGGEDITEQIPVNVLSKVSPTVLKLDVINKHPHNSDNFTQGFEFHKGELFEGTGQYEGGTSISKVDYKTGKVLLKKIGNPKDFGEGITILNNKLYQLTWQQGKCYVYDVNTLDKLDEFNFKGEGWGLTNDGENLIMSDGSQNIYFRDSKTFEIIKSFQVATNVSSVTFINELEYVNGKLYANIWQKNVIVEIDINSGMVLTIVDCKDIVREIFSSPKGKYRPDVLNGIAYNSNTKTFFITGKYWQNIFEVNFGKNPT